MSKHYSRIAGNIYRNDETGEDFVGSLDVLLPECERLRAENNDLRKTQAELINSLNISNGKYAKMREVLEMARNGLTWWKETYPLLVEECDYDALTEIESVLEEFDKNEYERFTRKNFLENPDEPEESKLAESELSNQELSNDVEDE